MMLTADNALSILREINAVALKVGNANAQQLHSCGRIPHSNVTARARSKQLLHTLPENPSRPTASQSAYRIVVRKCHSVDPAAVARVAQLKFKRGELNEVDVALLGAHKEVVPGRVELD